MKSILLLLLTEGKYSYSLTIKSSAKNKNKVECSSIGNLEFIKHNIHLKLTYITHFGLQSRTCTQCSVSFTQHDKQCKQKRRV